MSFFNRIYKQTKVGLFYFLWTKSITSVSASNICVYVLFHDTNLVSILQALSSIDLLFIISVCNSIVIIL